MKKKYLEPEPVKKGPAPQHCLAVLVRVKGTVPFQAWKVLPDLT